MLTKNQETKYLCVNLAFGLHCKNEIQYLHAITDISYVIFVVTIENEAIVALLLNLVFTGKKRTK